MNNDEASATTTDHRAPLLHHVLRHKKTPTTYARCASHPRDELVSFRAWLKCLCVDQSDPWNAALSWLVFLALAVGVPCLSHFVLACSECDNLHNRPYDAVAQLSLSGVSALSFLCLSHFVKKYGLRRFLFFDKLCDESEIVRDGYTMQFNRSLKLLFIFVLPCFAAETAYKTWWYASGGSRIPFLGNAAISNTVACILELCSWFYRTVVFFLVCVLFRLICYLQILRLQDFARVFQDHSDVGHVLTEHLRIRRNLKIISHRYRSFILGALILITASQFASLLMTTRASADVHIYHTGELAVCCISLLAGLMILLRSATRITHKALAITSLAAMWHVCATTDAFDCNFDAENDRNNNRIGNKVDEDDDGCGEEEDELDDAKIVTSYAHCSISHQKRQALVTYFENNRAGITIYGFILDRMSLRMIFGIELSLVLWLLGKTIGIS